MSKNYYCEYCDKRFKDDAKIRRKHTNGLSHQNARREHYAKYKEPKEIFEGESKKKRCSWFQSGYCQFGESCRFSHYTPEQIAELQQQVQYAEHKEWLSKQPKSYSKELIDRFMEKRASVEKRNNDHRLCSLFKYPQHFLQNSSDLPPSLQLIDVKLCCANDTFKFFG